MKRLFWPLLTIFAAFAVWFFARQQMDNLYAEISRLRLTERKYKAMNNAFDEMASDLHGSREAWAQSLSPEEKLDYEMQKALINAGHKGDKDA